MRTGLERDAAICTKLFESESSNRDRTCHGSWHRASGQEPGAPVPVASRTGPCVSTPLLGSAHAWFVGPRPEPRVRVHLTLISCALIVAELPSSHLLFWIRSCFLLEPSVWPREVPAHNARKPLKFDLSARPLQKVSPAHRLGSVSAGDALPLPLFCPRRAQRELRCEGNAHRPEGHGSQLSNQKTSLTVRKLLPTFSERHMVADLPRTSLLSQTVLTSSLSAHLCPQPRLPIPIWVLARTSLKYLSKASLACPGVNHIISWLTSDGAPEIFRGELIPVRESLLCSCTESETELIFSQVLPALLLQQLGQVCWAKLWQQFCLPQSAALLGQQAPRASAAGPEFKGQNKLSEIALPPRRALSSMLLHRGSRPHLRRCLAPPSRAESTVDMHLLRSRPRSSGAREANCSAWRCKKLHNIPASKRNLTRFRRPHPA